MTNQPFGWCFIGSGRITDRVYADFHRMDGAYVASVYSRNFEHAQALAERTGATAYRTLQEAVQDPRVQAVYVATTNNAHCPQTLEALELGKPVLCEKPFAMDAGEAGRMIDTARARGLYLMEGMWTRFNPVICQVRRWIDEGAIGRVVGLEATYAFRAEPDPTSRMYDKALGGGSLLDLGVYTQALSRIVFGEKPARVQAMAEMTDTGVDAQCAVTMQYESGAVARLFSGIRNQSVNDAMIYGETGRIHISEQFPLPKVAELTSPAGTWTYDGGVQGEGFMYEFNAVMADIRAGRLENELVTHRYTLDVMEVMDEVRKQIQLRW